MNRQEIDRLHELNHLRDNKLITAREYTTLRKELTTRSQLRQKRAIGLGEVICVFSPLLAIFSVLVSKQSGKKKFAVLTLSLILNMWVKVSNVTKSYEANTSTAVTSEEVIQKEK